MRIRWRNFELPSTVIVDEDTLTHSYGCFTIEPFEKGFGHTIGNGLRRVLLSSIEGTAVTSVRIDGVQHEFMTIPGVFEDVTDIVLNLKRLSVSLEGRDEADIEIRVDKAGELRAASIPEGNGISVLDKDHLICTLTDDVEVSMTLHVARGRGYVTAEEHEGEAELGVVSMDSNFSPVERVRYRVEETRVGKITNYDRLVLEIWTDGTVDPEDALVEASRIYRKHLNAFVHYRELDVVVPADDSGGRSVHEESEMRGESGDLGRRLSMAIEELDLSVRSRHCLDSENIVTLRDLVQRTEADLLKVRNFGKTSLAEIKKKLATLDLQLGMTFGPELQESGT
ncbi:MAG: DNA-directed RNA polymerase subunit alpha [Planctomycetes bacterium]|nr:DNA-directed RNA polymerase subunit alpha [Planctomycetota bacterium]